jgi:cytochrome c-type biogenesis protein CcmF
VGAALGTWIIAGAALDLWMRTGRSGLSRLVRLPRADWGKTVAHAGLGVTMLGISLMMAWQQEDIRTAQIGERFQVGAYSLTLVSVEEVPGPNYRSLTAAVKVSDSWGYETILHPEKRYYPVAAMPTTEAAIDNGVFRDIYAVIGDPQEGGGYAVRTYVKPFANWIWGGAMLMAFGGLLSLSDRRLRVAAGAAKAPRLSVAAE